MPTEGTANRPGPSLLERISELRALATERGRTSIQTGVSDAEPNAKVLDLYRAANVDRVLLRLPAAGPEEVLPVLKAHAELLKHYT
jgi:hypothetical protein